tara:strand:- start:153 stop:770 length:618 start_codon:yes stop_codon:yes gene_type:complete
MNKKNKILLLVVIAIVAVAAIIYFVIDRKEQAIFDSQNAVETVMRDDLGFEFGYTAGPDALSMVEPPVTGQPMEAAFIIMPSSEYVAFANGEDQDVGPTISLFVFRYSDNEMASTTEVLSKDEKLMTWAQENQTLTSINNATSDVVDYELDGLKGISYTAEAEYKQNIKLFRLGDRNYMFVGQYRDKGDQMDKYFEEVLSTVRFN